MMTTEQLHQTALDRLHDAKQAIARLLACSQDWTAKVMILHDLEYLEESINDFGRYQLLISNQNCSEARQSISKH